MRGGIVLVVLGITAVAAYSVGRQNVPATGAAVSVTATRTTLAKSVPFSDPVAQRPAPVATSRPIDPSTPSAKVDAPEKPMVQDNKRKVDATLTAAAIAAILIKASRDQYYATGHPCACPEDRTHNGRRCGGNSAHSRPGGATPLCYPSDVTAAMIESFRQRQASR
jgi:hypothetical protein